MAVEPQRQTNVLPWMQRVWTEGTLGERAIAMGSMFFNQILQAAEIDVAARDQRAREAALRSEVLARIDRQDRQDMQLYLAQVRALVEEEKFSIKDNPEDIANYLEGIADQMNLSPKARDFAISQAITQVSSNLQRRINRAKTTAKIIQSAIMNDPEKRALWEVADENERVGLIREVEFFSRGHISVPEDIIYDLPAMIDQFPVPRQRKGSPVQEESRPAATYEEFTTRRYTPPWEQQRSTPGFGSSTLIEPLEEE